MILRSLTKHVKDQNWFAVWIDFAIVVVGVFIGIQVANWNGDRLEARKRIDQLSQMHAEVLLGERISAGYTNYFEKYALPLFDLRKSIFGFSEPIRPEDETKICESILASASIPMPLFLLVTLNDIVTSGRLEEFPDPDFRANAQLVVARHKYIVELVKTERGRLINLAYEFPELISVGLKPDTSENDTDGVDPTAKCDFDSMITNNKFLNGLSNNINVFGQVADEYMNDNFANAKVQLHKAIDRQLGIQHEAESSE
jgi:hypothetical protein